MIMLECDRDYVGITNSDGKLQDSVEVSWKAIDESCEGGSFISIMPENASDFVPKQLK